MMLSEGEMKVLFLERAEVSYWRPEDCLSQVGGSHILALLHLGLKDLTVVLHAHNIGLGVPVGLGVVLAVGGHRRVNVPSGEYVGRRHCC
jgi:hypothetical protein